MDDTTFDKRRFSFLQPELLDKVWECSTVQTFDKGEDILSEEQYIKVLPIVIEGLVKVYSRFDDKELLLYYIEPTQSCVMTFYTALKNTPSKVNAVTADRVVRIVSYFNRQFKKQEHMTPNAYREAVRNKHNY